MPHINNLSLKELVEVLETHWTRPMGLVIVLILILACIEIPILIASNASSLIWLITLLASSAIIYIVWRWNRRIPKVKQGKVGFLISLSYETKEEEKIIRNDFILTLRKLIKSGTLGNKFQFIEIPQYMAEKLIDPEDAQELRIKYRADFMLYGQVRVRKLNGKEHHVINLEGIVKHRTIPTYISQKLANEFAELLPRKVTIAPENDLLSFQFTAEWTEIVAKYVIGIAAAVSGEWDYAEELYQDALNKSRNRQTNFPIYAKLKERVPTRLAEINEARALLTYENWVKKHEDIYISKLGEYLGKIDDQKFTRASVLSLKTIYVFLSNRDVKKALFYLNLFNRAERDAIWFLNYAFLSAYDGNLKRATKLYQKALKFSIQPDLLMRIEDFLCYMAEKEPDKCEVHFCLGMFNWQIKGDTKQAMSDFNSFLTTAPNNKYLEQRQWTTEWMKTSGQQGNGL